MIRSIRHKGLKRLYEDDDARGVIREHEQKLRDILARLDAAERSQTWICQDFGCIRSRVRCEGFGRLRSGQIGEWFSGLSKVVL